MSAYVAFLAGDYAGRLTVAALDVDENPATAERYGVMGLPTLLFLSNGVEVDRVVGLVPYEDLKRQVERLLAASLPNPLLLPRCTMRVSKLFFQTLREVPADAEIVSHQLLLRAGMIHQIAAGIFDLLPLALRVKHKIEDIFRAEMDAIGGQEVTLARRPPG